MENVIEDTIALSVAEQLKGLSKKEIAYLILNFFGREDFDLFEKHLIRYLNEESQSL